MANSGVKRLAEEVGFVSTTGDCTHSERESSIAMCDP
jgi:hypothetical protein